MSETTTPAELEIPTAARAEYAEHHRLPLPNSSAVDWDEVDRDLRAFSRPIVAAELRRIVEEWYGHGLVEDGVLERLERRADELDPQP